jgi:histidine ammonia-lyase
MHLADIAQLNTTPRIVRFDQNRLTIEDIVDIAQGRAMAALSDDPAFRATIQRGADFLERLLREDGTIYGVTTGYGDSCTVTVPPELVADLPHHLYTYHGVGLGEYFTPPQTRAILASRLASLSKGYSGVSVELLLQITRLLDAGLLPLIPSEGSVGASGDLTPLSYLAAVLCGEREVWRDGVQVPAAQALQEAGIAPLRLRPKEGLAIMNGTAVMTALACMAYDRAEYLTRLTTRITAMASFAMDGNAHHFDEVLFSVKPHAGMQQVAAWLRSDLPTDQWERVLHGGHFYGGHIAFAMDGMKNAVANLADLLDRQMALMVDSRYNHGLPANLSGATGSRAAINHGLKALQISASAWTAEALKLTMPASVFSRSTECHNQDKVSMGTIAARDCLRVLELTEQVVAALLITVRQGVWLRCQVSPELQPQAALAAMQEALGADIKPVEEDRRLEPDLRLLLELIRAKAWDLYA